MLAAQDAGQAPPPPDFLNRKRPLPIEIVTKKKENTYLTGFPMIGVDPEIGPVLGAQVQIFDNGPRTSSFFEYAPYRRSLMAGAQTSTTGEFWSAFVAYDQPYIADTPWRLKGWLGYTQHKNRNYFGTGEETLDALHYPGSPRTFEDFHKFEEAIEGRTGGITWSKYIHYHQRYFVGAVNLEHDLFGGLVRPLVGLQFGRVGVTDYTGRLDDGAVQQETKLAEDHRRGRILGIDGGWDNSIRIGLSYDSRDYEPDPTTGILAQTFVTGTLRGLGSEFDYGQATFGLTAFTPVLPDSDRLVAVGNATYAVRFGDVPFYAMNRLALPKNEVRTGLGAFPTLRGYGSNRYVGRVTIGAAAELRWSFWEFILWDQRLKTALAPFLDAGRVFDSPGSFATDHWKYSWGVGIRLAWNLATVISFDYGVSSEDRLFFMEVGHPF